MARLRIYFIAAGSGRPEDLPLQLEQTETVAAAVAQAWSPHASLIYSDPGTAVWVGAHDPASERVTVLTRNRSQDDPLLAGLYDTLIVVWNHKAQGLSDRLDQNAYRTFEVGDDFASVAIYGRPQTALTTLEVSALWPEVSFVQLQGLSTVAAGQVLPLATTMTLPAARIQALHALTGRGRHCSRQP